MNGTPPMPRRPAGSRRSLSELVEELPELRQSGGGSRRALFAGPTARRMEAAVSPLAEKFITPMAAVAGSVADEILAAMIAGRSLEKAYVNNGGDIALHLAEGQSLTLAVAGTGNGFADRAVIRADGPGARRRHQRLARPQFFARHRRCGDGAGAERRGGRRGRDA